MCQVHGLFFPSFPVGAMSTSQILRAATAHLRLPRMLKESSSIFGPALAASEPLSVPSTSWKRIEWPTSAIAYNNAEFGNALLVPGGRFMLVAHRGTGALSLWDLGPPCQPHAIPIRMAHIALANGRGHPLHKENSLEGRLAIAMVSDCLTVVVTTYGCKTVESDSLGWERTM